MLHQCTESMMVDKTASLEVTLLDLDSVPRQEIFGCVQSVEPDVCEVGDVMIFQTDAPIFYYYDSIKSR